MKTKCVSNAARDPNEWLTPALILKSLFDNSFKQALPWKGGHLPRAPHFYRPQTLDCALKSLLIFFKGTQNEKKIVS